MKTVEKLKLARKQLATWERRREEAIQTLVKAEDKLPGLRRTVKRLADRILTQPESPKPWPLPLTVKAETTSMVEPLDIPDYLQRAKPNPKDVEAAEQIKAQLAEQKKAAAERNALRRKIKAETIKADLTGATRKMPLTDKEALAAIRGYG